MRPSLEQPFRVVIDLAAGVPLDHPWIHFDALLASLTARAGGPLSEYLRVVAGVAHASISFFDPAPPGRYSERIGPHVVHARTCTFYGCGDIDAVRAVLADLDGIGDGERGQVLAVHVEARDEDWSVLRDGIAQRPIPRWQCVDPVEIAVPLTWRVPYWSGDVEPCVPPGAPCVLRSGRLRKDAYNFRVVRGRRA